MSRKQRWQEEKRRNVLVFRVPEASSPVTAELLTKMDIPDNVGSSDLRLNAGVGKMRPLFVVMRSEGDKGLLVDKSRLLRSDVNVTVKPDLTELQQEEDKGEVQSKS